LQDGVAAITKWIVAFLIIFLLCMLLVCTLYLTRNKKPPIQHASGASPCH